MCDASGPKISLFIFVQNKGDEMGVAGLDYGDLGWGREWGWGGGEGLVD